VARTLRYLPWFDAENIVGIGWPELPESPLKMTRQELAAMMRATYPDALAGTIANNTGQIWNFINTIALGDLVVVPPAGIAVLSDRAGSRPQPSAVRTCLS
jgi:predicted Mrr-cat superfamily restriction endonuclease